MNAYAECQEQKDRVKACYGGWFQKLWGGSYDRHSCEQETEDYRQCVQDVMKRNKDQGKRKVKNTENDWMDGVKDKSNELKNRTNEAAEEAKGRARNARDRVRDGKDEAEGKLKSTASSVTSKVQETADSWADKIKGFGKKAENKAQNNYYDDDE